MEERRKKERKLTYVHKEDVGSVGRRGEVSSGRVVARPRVVEDGVKLQGLPHAETLLVGVPEVSCEGDWMLRDPCTKRII